MVVTLSRISAIDYLHLLVELIGKHDDRPVVVGKDDVMALVTLLIRGWEDMLNKRQRCVNSNQNETIESLSTLTNFHVVLPVLLFELP